jgi:hypothetical protein
MKTLIIKLSSGSRRTDGVRRLELKLKSKSNLEFNSNRSPIASVLLSRLLLIDEGLGNSASDCSTVSKKTTLGL